MKYLEKQVILVNSRKRVSGTSSNFSFDVPFTKGNEYDSIAVLRACIPKTYYSVQANYNTFTVIEKGVSTELTVTKGNYSVQAIAAVIGAQLTENSATLGNNWTYTITFPNNLSAVNTGKLTFTVSGSGLTAPSFSFSDALTSGMFEILGFEPDTTYAFEVSGATYALTSVNVVKLQPDDTLYITSNICSNQSMQSNSVIQEIYTNTGTGAYGNIVFEQFNVEANAKKLSSSEAGVYTFQITNEDGEIIDFNGINVNISLLAFKQNDTSRLIRGITKTFSFVLGELAPFIEWFSDNWTQYFKAEQ